MHGVLFFGFPLVDYDYIHYFPGMSSDQYDELEDTIDEAIASIFNPDRIERFKSPTGFLDQIDQFNCVTGTYHVEDCIQYFIAHKDALYETNEIIELGRMDQKPKEEGWEKDVRRAVQVAQDILTAKVGHSANFDQLLTIQWHLALCIDS